jgi:flagellar protein FliO/FliZ
MIPFTSKRGARFACVLTFLYALAILCVAPAWAAKTTTGTTTATGKYGQNTPLNLNSGGVTHPNSASFSGTIVRTIVGLAIVIAVIYGITWLLRQSRSARNPPMGDGLAQIASLPLGTNRSVSLVRVGDELHLLGVADQAITSIRVFNEEQAYELGLPFDPEDTFAGATTTGVSPMQRVVELLRRLTAR